MNFHSKKLFIFFPLTYLKPTNPLSWSEFNSPWEIAGTVKAFFTFWQDFNPFSIFPTFRKNKFQFINFECALITNWFLFLLENMQILICIERKIIFHWNKHISLSTSFLRKKLDGILAVNARDFFYQDFPLCSLCDEQEIWIVDLFILLKNICFRVYQRCRCNRYFLSHITMNIYNSNTTDWFGNIWWSSDFVDWVHSTVDVELAGLFIFQFRRVQVKSWWKLLPEKFWDSSNYVKFTDDGWWTYQLSWTQNVIAVHIIIRLTEINHWSWQTTKFNSPHNEVTRINFSSHYHPMNILN